MTEEFKRKLTAILSADVAGYSRLMDDDEEATIRTLKDYRSLIAENVEKHRGRVVDSPGDNILAEFASVVDAVKCAVEIQKSLSEKNAELNDDRKMQFRIGINLGDVVEEDDRIYGDGVNIAARVESFAEAGGICISGRAYDHVENKIDVEYEFLGEKTAKNIKRPIRVFKIPVEFESEQETEESILDSIVDLSVPTDKPSIAVLPFVNMSDDPEQEYFSDGITEEIITALSKIPNMLVIARNSTFVYKGKAVDIKQVGNELGVKYVLEGSVRKAGNKLRLTTQLIDVATGSHLWAERLDRNIEDIFSVQDEMTLEITKAMQVSLTDGIQAQHPSLRTKSLSAYLKYLEGRIHITAFNKDDNAYARALHEEVIKLDPNWALGYAGLGVAHIIDFWGGWSSDPELCLQEAVKYTQKALSIDNTSSPFPYINMSLIYLYKRQYDEAISEAKKAVSLAPNFWAPNDIFGYVLINAGMPKEAIGMCKKAMRVSPFDWVSIYHLGIAYCDSGQYDESITAFKKAIERNPTNLHVQVYLVAAYVLAGQQKNAFKEADEVLKIDPTFSVSSFAHSIPYKNQSDTDRILNALRKAGLK